MEKFIVGRIVRYRKQRGWTQAELARRLQKIEPKASAQLVSNWEFGTFIPSDRYRKAICKAFRLPRKAFLDD